MAAVNRVILIGNLGRDPETRVLPNGKNKVTTFSLATSEKYKDQQGNQQEKTEWHNIKAWNRQAEVIQEYAKKGTSLFIEGSLSTTSWDDATSGQKRYKTEIVVRSFQFIGNTKQQNSNGGGYGAPAAPAQGGYSSPITPSAPNPGPQGAGGYSAPPAQASYGSPGDHAYGSNSNPDDDLPF